MQVGMWKNLRAKVISGGAQSQWHFLDDYMEVLFLTLSSLNLLPDHGPFGPSAEADLASSTTCFISAHLGGEVSNWETGSAGWGTYGKLANQARYSSRGCLADSWCAPQAPALWLPTSWSSSPPADSVHIWMGHVKTSSLPSLSCLCALVSVLPSSRL